MLVVALEYRMNKITFRRSTMHWMVAAVHREYEYFDVYVVVSNVILLAAL